MGFLSILSFAQRLVEERARQGDIVIDATVGNGVDTVFLAKLVGAKGKVYGFDIQQEAIDRGAARIKEQLGDNSFTTLFLRSHSEMLETVPVENHGKVSAVMFNLGYLPGADQGVITRSDTTLQALDAACRLLKTGGVVTIALYIGHPGGLEEAHEVERWLQDLPQKEYQVLKYQFLNQKQSPPYLIAVEKRG